jgi:hypothetical protein
MKSRENKKFFNPARLRSLIALIDKGIIMEYAPYVRFYVKTMRFAELCMDKNSKDTNNYYIAYI